MKPTLHISFLFIFYLVICTRFSAASLVGDLDSNNLGLFDDEAMDEAFLSSPLTSISTIKELETFIQPESVKFAGGVVGVFAKESEDSKSFQEFARPLDGNGYRFAVSVGQQAILDKYGVKDGWKIFVHPPPGYLSEHEKSKFRFGGTDVTSEAGRTSLKNFIIKHYLPLASRISPIVANERIFVEHFLPVFIVISHFDEELDPKGVTYILNRLRKIAEKYKDRMTFAILDKEDTEGTIRFHKRFFVGEDTELAKAEQLIGIKDGKNYYARSGPFSIESATKLVEDFFSGAIKPVSYQEDIIDDVDELEDMGEMDPSEL